VRSSGYKSDGVEVINFERSILVPKRGHGIEDAG
jgi:hypothetical protein